MSSKISICRTALLSLGGDAIATLSADSTSAHERLAASLWPIFSDSLLRSHTWHCAIKRVTLSPETTAPINDYSYKFLLPGDWLRTLQVGDAGSELDYVTEGGRILCDSTTLNLRYIYRNEDVGNWDSMLIQAATLGMASAMAYAVTRSSSEAQTRKQEFQFFMKQARAVDGQDDPAQTLGDSPTYQAGF